MYATKIKMKPWCLNSQNPLEIESIFIEGANPEVFYPKDVIHDFLKQNPNTIRVKLNSQPFLIPALSIYGEKYVKSTPNDSLLDNLMNLPRI